MSAEGSLEDFTRERDEVFTRFVLEDDWQGVEAYMIKYELIDEAPKNPNVVKAAMYKAVQECRSIPAEVKAEAARKCREMGFRPTMFSGQ